MFEATVEILQKSIHLDNVVRIYLVFCIYDIFLRHRDSGQKWHVASTTQLEKNDCVDDAANLNITKVIRLAALRTMDIFLNRH